MSNDLFKAQLTVTSPSKSGMLVLFTEYVSYRGIFMRSATPPPKMELLRLEMVLPPTAQRVLLHGMVTGIVPPTTKDELPRVQISFFAKVGEMAGQWDDFIHRLRDRYPQSMVKPSRAGQEACATLSFGLPSNRPPEAARTVSVAPCC